MTRRRLPRWSELAELRGPGRRGLSRTQRRLAGAACVADLRESARRRVPRAVFDYTDGAADAEVSRERSRQAFGRVEFVPSVLRDVGSVTTACEVLGQPAAMPVVLGPTGFTRMMHHAGEVAVARAAGRAGVPYALSTMGTTSVEALATAAPGTRRWFQLYLWRDRAAGRDLVDRAWASGYDTLVLTVDTAVAGRRLRDVRNGMTIPPSIGLRTVLDGALHPSWWVDFLTTEPLEFASLRSWGGTASDLVNRLFDPTATLEDLRWLREAWPGKLVVKGVLGVEDALACADAGVDGVVVSDHGGRQLDRAPIPLEQLPVVAEAVGDRVEVLMDGGVMSGADVAAALGLGARAVLVGRAYLYGLMAGGEPGVDRVLELLRDELVATLQLLGVTSPAELTEGRVRLR